MSFGDHLNTQTKRGCVIVTSNPQTGEIEAKIQRGEIVPVNAYSFTPFFRWPMVGENWIIREENGSWFLESVFEEQRPTFRSNTALVHVQSGLLFTAKLRPIKIK